jgi:hypothetical protein
MLQQLHHGQQEADQQQQKSQHPQNQSTCPHHPLAYVINTKYASIGN